MKIKALLLAILISSFAYAKSEVHKMRWVLAHEPARVFERSARAFADIVKKESKGRLLIEIVTADKLKKKGPISPYQAFDLVKSGQFEMCQTYTTYLGHKNKNMWVLDLPFLFRDHEHASKVLDGVVGQRILAGLDGTGVKGLAFTYSGGFRVIPTDKKAIEKAEDFKGMKIRIADSPVAAAYLKELGAIPVQQVADEDFYKKGMDGFETTYARLEIIKDNESHFINETEHSLFLTSILINKDFYDKLPTDLQDIVNRAVLATAKIERNDSVQDGLDLKKKYEKHGIKIVKLKDSEVEKLKNAAEKVKEKYSKFFDKNLIADIQKQ